MKKGKSHSCQLVLGACLVRALSLKDYGTGGHSSVVWPFLSQMIACSTVIATNMRQVRGGGGSFDCWERSGKLTLACPMEEKKDQLRWVLRAQSQENPTMQGTA